MVRVKRRYLCFEVVPNGGDHNLTTGYRKLDITERQVRDTVRQTIADIYGDYGLASVQLSFSLKRFNQTTRTGVLAIKRSVHTILLTALPFVKRINQLDCFLKSIHLSGTIRGCLKALAVHHNKQIVKLRGQLSKTTSSSLLSSVANQRLISDIESAHKDIETSLLVHRIAYQPSSSAATEDNIDG
ncbi:ribonuclease P/MRP protein subunit POP5-like [Oppia nitens]|uniref:ribonuclease P/MRP protein subunit POP5-like n=1 Tax=Oppia nitens TaxID=1686743 RepID=UPI0023DBC920|nr:ribonuclease P/MRP protein subunit POP5-like [Oppia nitens]